MELIWQAADTTPETKAIETPATGDTLDAYRVILFNDEEHSFDEVIFQLIKAVRCTRVKAEQHAWEVHTKGRSVVFFGNIAECIRVSAILEEIALKTEIQTG
jgi:ATP-dependent Clp protease adapter protein ClpS